MVKKIDCTERTLQSDRGCPKIILTERGSTSYRTKVTVPVTSRVS